MRTVRRNPAQGGNWSFKLFDNSVSKDDPVEVFSGSFSDLPDALRAAITSRVFNAQGAVKTLPVEVETKPKASADDAILQALSSVVKSGLEKKLEEANR